MVLAIVVGVVLREYAGLSEALPWSILGGLFVALLVPAKSSCPLRPKK